MKTIHKILLIFFLIPMVSFAGIVRGKYTKEKKINKTYTVNNNAGLQVANKYGNIVITTWDEDRTDIDVHIIVSGNDEDAVNKRLNSINVKLEANSALVSATTVLGNFRGRNISMEINYTIKIPRNGTLGIGNQYGDLRLGKIYGGMNIDVQYGGLNIEEANNDNNKIRLQYANGSKIGVIKNANINMQYSDMNINSAGILIVDSDYSNLRIGSLRTISMGMDYGDLVIGSANIINLKSDYSQFKCNQIDNLLNVSMDYGDIKVNNIAPTARNITVNSSYGGTKLNFAPDTGFSFEIYLDYGGLSGKDLLNFSEKTEKPSFARYKGTSIRGTGNCKVYAKADYGDIKISRG